MGPTGVRLAGCLLMVVRPVRSFEGMLLERNSIGSGMLVRGASGERLGRVYAAGRDVFWVRPRFRKLPRFEVRLGDVRSLARGDVHLRAGSSLLTPIPDPKTPPEPLLSVRPLSLDEQERLSSGT
ncbi:MAG: hypothetical protein ACJ790_08575 [Myxococcaceae bacterium]